MDWLQMGVGPSLSVSFPRPRCAGRKHRDRSMAEERVESSGHEKPGEKTSIKGGGAGPEVPPVGPRPEEAEATQHPRATVMTGIEAGRRAEELGEGVRTA